MNKTVLTAIIALLVGVGIGLGAAALFSDDTQPTPSPRVVKEQEKERKSEKEQRNEPDHRKVDRSERSLPKTPVEKPNSEQSTPDKEAAISYRVSKDAVAEAAQALGIEASDEIITGVVVDSEGEAIVGATVLAITRASKYSEVPGQARVRLREKYDGRKLELAELYAGEGSTLLGRAMMGMSRMVVTDRDGRFELKDLYQTRYQVAVLGKGGTFNERNMVRANLGDDLRIVISQDRVLNIELRLPDGTTPQSGYVEVRPAGQASYRRNYYRWSPDSRIFEIESDYLVLSAIDSEGHFEAPSRTIDVSKLKGEKSVLLELEALTGIDIAIKRPEGGAAAKAAQASFYIASAEKSFANPAALGQGAMALGGEERIVNTSLEAGAYKLYMTRGQKILEQKTITIVAGQIAKAQMEIPPLAEEDFQNVVISGLPPEFQDQLQFGIRVEKSHSRSGYQAEFIREGEIYRVVMVEQGGGRSRSYESEKPHSHDGKAPTRDEGPTKYTLTVSARNYGEASSAFVPNSGETLHLEFPARASLMVTIKGYDGKKSDHRDSSLVVEDNSDPSRSKNLAYLELGETIDSHGIILLPNLAVGDFDLILRLRSRHGRDERLKFPVTLHEGSNSTEITIPERYSLKINVPFQEGLNHARVTLYRGDEHINQKFTSVKVNQDNIVDFGEISVGEYRAEIRINGKTMEMTFSHQQEQVHHFIGVEKR